MIELPRASIGILLGVISFAAIAAQLLGQDAARSALPEGNSGIASRYPGDVGIDQDPAVVFAENFEGPTLDAVIARWDSVSTRQIMSLSGDVPPGSGGRQSLRMTHVGGQSTGGHLYRRLLPGYDQLYFRFHVKFDPRCYPIHHFFHVGGYNPPTRWPQGGAGERPRGDERFSTGVEPFGNAWRWDYYSYWMDMRGSPPRGQTWGNSFVHDRDLKVARGQWISVELMMKMNDLGDSNGEMALWIDGTLASHVGKGFPRGKWVYDKFLPGQGGDGIRWSDERHGPQPLPTPAAGQTFEGFQWRKDADLKLNFLWLLLYITGAPEGHTSDVWFDCLVVAKDYIGPIRPGC